jgi:tetratricopeptide (TPR) repeat protein
VGRPIRLLATLAIAVAAGLAAAPDAAGQALLPQWDACRNADGRQSLDQRMAGCTAMIQSDDETPKGKALAYALRGSLHDKKKELAEALADFDRSLDLDPTLDEVYRGRGNVRADQGNLALALADYAEALRLNPASKQTYIDRGAAYARQRQFDKAIADYTEAVRIDPNFFSGYVHRAAAFERLGQIASAKADTDQALRIQPQNADLLSARCFLRAVLGQELEGALADCTESLKLKPGELRATTARGMVQFKRGMFEASLQDFEAANRIAPAAPDPIYGRGLAKLKLGRTAEGQADLLAASAIDPVTPSRLKAYGMVQ